MHKLLKVFMGFLLCMLSIYWAIMNGIEEEKRKEAVYRQQIRDEIMFDIRLGKGLDLEPLISAEDMDSIVDKTIRDMEDKQNNSEQ